MIPHHAKGSTTSSLASAKWWAIFSSFRTSWCRFLSFITKAKKTFLQVSASWTTWSKFRHSSSTKRGWSNMIRALKVRKQTCENQLVGKRVWILRIIRDRCKVWTRQWRLPSQVVEMDLRLPPIWIMIVTFFYIIIITQLTLKEKLLRVKISLVPSVSCLEDQKN